MYIFGKFHTCCKMCILVLKVLQCVYVNLTYIAFFKSTLKTQCGKNSQMHKAISFMSLAVLFNKELVGGLCFLFLLNEKSKTVRGTGPELFSQLHSDF